WLGGHGQHILDCGPPGLMCPVGKHHLLCCGGVSHHRSAPYKLPRRACSRSNALKRAWILPLPKPRAFLRWMISIKKVGRLCTGKEKICSRYPHSSRSTSTFTSRNAAVFSLMLPTRSAS